MKNSSLHMSISPITNTVGLAQAYSGLAHKPADEKFSLDTSETNTTTATKNALVKSPNSVEKSSGFQKFLERNLKLGSTDNSKTIDPNQMQARLADIKHKGALVMQHPLPKHVQSYIEDVRSFLTDVQDQAYSNTKNSDQVFEKVQVVDKALDDLAEELLQGQKNELKLVNSLGRLQGLLIDIFV